MIEQKKSDCNGFLDGQSNVSAYSREAGPWNRAIGPFLSNRQRDPFIVSLTYAGTSATSFAPNGIRPTRPGELQINHLFVQENCMKFELAGYISDSRGIRRHYGGDAVSINKRNSSTFSKHLNFCAQAGGMHMYSATPMAAHVLMLPSSPRSITRDSVFQPPAGQSIYRDVSHTAPQPVRVRSHSLQEAQHNIAERDQLVHQSNNSDECMRIDKEKMLKSDLVWNGLNAIPSKSHVPLSTAKAGSIEGGKSWLRGIGKGRSEGQPAAGRPSLSFRLA